MTPERVSLMGAPNPHQLSAFVRALLGLLEDLAYPADVHLVVDDPGLEWRPLPCEEPVSAAGARADHGVEDADDLEVVVGVPLQVLLTVDTADDGMSRHEDPRLGAVAAGRPAALAGFDAAVRVELRGRLAEVPDVAL